MRPENVAVIAKREYLTRIRSKAFWIGTVALPLLMAAWLILPGLVMAKARAKQRLVVIDTTGEVAEKLVERLTARAGSKIAASFEIEVLPAADAVAQQAELDRRVLADEIDAWIRISAEGLERDRVDYHAASVSNFVTQEILEDALSQVVRELRLAAAGYDAAAVGELSRPLALSSVRISEEGSRAGGGIGDIILAVGLFMMLYMTIIIYGNQVMSGVLEEKSSRVVEIILSAVRPTEFMAGKLLGICLVALTQLGIWLGAAAALTAPGLLVAIAWLPPSSEVPRLSLGIVGHFFVLFLLGFFLFATFWAMLGSAFNSHQEAQQLSGVAAVFLVAPWVFFMPVLNDPDSTLALITSLIPPFTPLLMMLRIAVKTPPLWQILLSYALTASFCGLMIWLSARVYRVGILMYGKKPTLREIWRWVRYA